MGHAFWLIATFFVPLWVIRGGWFSQNPRSLIYASVGYSAVITAMAMSVWDFSLFGSIFVTWAITLVGVIAACVVIRNLGNL